MDLGLVYFDLIPNDITITIYYKLLDLDCKTWHKFINLTNNLNVLLNNNNIIKIYLLNKYKNLYPALFDEDLNNYKYLVKTYSISNLDNIYILYCALKNKK